MGDDRLEQLRAKYPRSYCSWCFRSARHRIVHPGMILRTERRCLACGNRTYRCRYCDNMARGALDKVPEGLISRLRASWADELCAEHDGTIASFEALPLKLDDLASYERLFKRRKRNLKRVATTI